jgi:hypothetical protein
MAHLQIFVRQGISVVKTTCSKCTVTILIGLRSIDCRARDLIEVVIKDSLKHSSMVNGSLSVIEVEITTMLPKFTANNWATHTELLMVKADILNHKKNSGSTIFNATDLKDVLKCVMEREVSNVPVDIPKCIVLTMQYQLSIDWTTGKPIEMVFPESCKQSKMVYGSMLVLITQI